MATEMVRPLRRWGIDLLGGRTRKDGKINFFSFFAQIIVINNFFVSLGDFYQKTKGGMGKPCLLRVNQKSQIQLTCKA